jgi:hypothetical protein
MGSKGLHLSDEEIEQIEVTARFVALWRLAEGDDGDARD